MGAVTIDAAMRRSNAFGSLLEIAGRTVIHSLYQLLPTGHNSVYFF
jgi:hypothetical protein